MFSVIEPTKKSLENTEAKLSFEIFLFFPIETVQFIIASWQPSLIYEDIANKILRSTLMKVSPLDERIIQRILVPSVNSTFI